MNHLLTTSTTHGGRFLASQALSSAQMVRHIVLDEMRRGDFSNLSERVERIDHLVREGLLVRADEHGLTLLAAQFLGYLVESALQFFHFVADLNDPATRLARHLFHRTIARISAKTVKSPIGN